MGDRVTNHVGFIEIFRKKQLLMTVAMCLRIKSWPMKGISCAMPLRPIMVQEAHVVLSLICVITYLVLLSDTLHFEWKNSSGYVKA